MDETRVRFSVGPLQNMSNQKAKNHYGSFAKYYDFGTFLFEILFFRRFRKYLLKSAKGKILEIGAGTGKNLPYYPKDSDLTLTDFTPEMLEIAKKRAKKLRISANFKLADSEKLPFKSKNFDTIVDTLGLCTYPNPLKALNEMKRVCKPSGKIILIEHGSSNIQLIQKIQHGREPKHLKSTGCSLTRNYLNIIKKSNLKIMNIKRNFFGIFYLIELKL